MATDITQHYSLVIKIGCPAPVYTFYPPNTAANRPANGWFLFLISILEKKMYFMLRCNHTIIKNVCAELAT
ncbi:MAG: hypothetical protein KME59_01655 [Trichormus sp. ATA11-4-KO1]|nr:hypothetical protein [Trichormus sp. ATA11-4-KO1]